MSLFISALEFICSNCFVRTRCPIVFPNKLKLSKTDQVRAHRGGRSPPEVIISLQSFCPSSPSVFNLFVLSVKTVASVSGGYERDRSDFYAGFVRSFHVQE